MRRTTAPVSAIVTIRDVAMRAKVSPSSVSNALTGRRPVSEATRRRVQKAVKQLGYYPNMLARSLVNRRSNTLGVVTWGLEYFGPSRTLAGIERQANEYGYSLLLNLLHRPDESNVTPSLTALTARRVDGVIWAVPEVGKNRSWISRELLKRLPPTVFLTMGAQPRLRVVAIDNRAGAALAVQHMVDRGRRKIGLVTGPMDWWEARERHAGWQEALHLAGLEVSESLVIEGDWSPDSGERRLRRLLAQRPDIDGVFVSNDQMALGALRVAHEMSQRVPQDLAIVGFDNIPESAYFWPPLTTVSHPLMELGRIAVQKLHKIIETGRNDRGNDDSSATMLGPMLVVRESS